MSHEQLRVEQKYCMSNTLLESAADCQLAYVLAGLWTEVDMKLY